MCARVLYLTSDILSGLESIISLIAFLSCHPSSPTCAHVIPVSTEGMNTHVCVCVRAHFVRFLPLPPVQLSVVLSGRRDQRCDGSLLTADECRAMARMDQCKSGYGFLPPVPTLSHLSLPSQCVQVFKSTHISAECESLCVSAE